MAEATLPPASAPKPLAVTLLDRAITVAVAVIGGILLQWLNLTPAPVVPPNPPAVVEKDAKPPVSHPALVLAATEYTRTMAETFRFVAAGLKDGSLKDKDSVIAVLGRHSAPLAAKLESTFADYTNGGEGPIVGPARLAVVFEAAADAIEHGGGK